MVRKHDLFEGKRVEFLLNFLKKWNIFSHCICFHNMEKNLVKSKIIGCP